MTRINTNVSSLVAQKTLSRSNDQLQQSLLRLSTGLQINVGRDNPAGLIASEVLRSDITNVQRAVTNSERANQLIATADSALGQVGSLLNDIRGLVSEAANSGALSADQISANQLTIDSSLESIDRIARVTSFQGQRLLDGGLDFITTSPGTIDQNAATTIGSVAADVAAAAAVSGGAANTDITFTAVTAGANQNGVSVSFVNGGSAGGATVTFAAGSLTFTIASGGTAANAIISALNDSTTAAAAFTASLGTGDGTGTFSAGAAAGATSFTGGVDGNTLDITAAQAGTAFNDVTIQFASGGSSDAESVVFNSSAKTLTITIEDGASTALQVASAINAEGTFSAAVASGSNGSGAVAVSSTATTSGGLSEANISSLQIDQANFGTQSAVGVNLQIDTQATQAQLNYSGGSLTSDVTVEIGGSQGFEVFSFGSGSTISEVATAINLVSDATGVDATVNGTDLELKSQNFGSKQFVSSKVLNGSSTAFQTYDTTGASQSRVDGTDLQARINGITATTDGLNASINTSTLDLKFSVNQRLVAGNSVSFNITGGGANFQLGPDVVSNQQARLGVQGVNTATLGGVSGTLFELRSGGLKALGTNTTGAAKVVDEVLSKVTSLRGRLGAFQKTTLQTNIFTLNDTLENLTTAESSIRDTDFAAESARLTRAQILVQAGTSVLSIANQNPQNVLALLR